MKCLPLQVKCSLHQTCSLGAVDCPGTWTDHSPWCRSWCTEPRILPCCRQRWNSSFVAVTNPEGSLIKSKKFKTKICFPQQKHQSVHSRKTICLNPICFCPTTEQLTTRIAIFMILFECESHYHLLAVFHKLESYLWDVRIKVRPLALTFSSVSQSSLRATGSIPVVGSSRKMMGGSPTKAMAVLNFRLLPPLGTKKKTSFNAWGVVLLDRG